MFIRKVSGRSVSVYGLILLFISINQQLYPQWHTLQAADWSPPQTIPLYGLETLTPILIPDQNRTVHAFSSQWKGEEDGLTIRSIVYNRWSYEQGWTPPTDIIISPYKQARITDAYLDRNGTFHVVFFGGDGTGADIYYANAPAALADNAHAWSAPLLIGEKAGDPENAVLLESNEGALFVIYYGRELGSGLYVVSSTDRGKNWSDSTAIFLAQSEEPNISLLHAIKTESGSLHVIWGVYSVGGQGRGIFYSRSDDGIEWDEPVLLADSPTGLGTQTPTIIEYDDTLFALYNMPPKITMRRSFDDGKTWDKPVALFPRHVGVNGSLSLVIDGNNELHLFFGQRISGNPDIHGLWHSVFTNSRWTEPEAVIRGPRIVDAIGLTGFDPYDARAVVSQGNVALVTWRTDPGDIRANGVWFSYKRLDAPEIPLATLQPVISNSPTPSPSPAPVPTSTLKINDLGQIPFENAPETRNPFGWLTMGVVVAGILGVIYILSKRDR